MLSIVEEIKSNSAYFEDFITRYTYHSTHIEGNILTYEETYSVIFDKDHRGIKTANTRDIHEVINHKRAIDYVMANINEDISLELIKHIGVIINKNINDISDFRKTSVAIKGTYHIPPSPQELRMGLYYFLDGYKNVVFDDIFEKISSMHIQFEKLHPFEDGNGRTGRLLVNYELLKNNMLPIVIPVEKRGIYFDLLSKYESKGLAILFKELHDLEKNRAAHLGLKSTSTFRR